MTCPCLPIARRMTLFGRLDVLAAYPVCNVDSAAACIGIRLGRRLGWAVPLLEKGHARRLEDLIVLPASACRGIARSV